MSLSTELVGGLLPVFVRALGAKIDGDPKTKVSQVLKQSLFGDVETTPEQDNLISLQAEVILANTSTVDLVGQANEAIFENHVVQLVYHLSEALNLVMQYQHDIKQVPV